jgi:hypothetical protein
MFLEANVKEEMLSQMKIVSFRIIGFSDEVEYFKILYKVI